MTCLNIIVPSQILASSLSCLCIRGLLNNCFFISTSYDLQLNQLIWNCGLQSSDILQHLQHLVTGNLDSIWSSFGFALWKLELRLNSDKRTVLWILFNKLGSLFQTTGAAWQKARFANAVLDVVLHRIRWDEGRNCLIGWLTQGHWIQIFWSLHGQHLAC